MKADAVEPDRSAAEHHDVAGATVLLRQHVHDELTRDMKLTNKPLFAEISKAAAGGQAKSQS